MKFAKLCAFFALLLFLASWIFPQFAVFLLFGCAWAVGLFFLALAANGRI